MRAVEVFTPNSQPNITYVERSGPNLERLLRDALEIPNMAISVSGPSKSGKTVLLSKVIEKDLIIPVSGASVRSTDDLWGHVLNWMGGVEEVTLSEGSSTGISGSVNAGGSLGLPGLLGARAEGAGSASSQSSREMVSRPLSTRISRVISEIAGSDFVVFLDDFHYIPQQLQGEIGKQIKFVVENGVRICTASVPHRSDDVVRSNAELTGRLFSIDMKFWPASDLEKIATQGFPALNANIDREIVQRMAREAFGSPQLMQALCLNLCLEFGVRETAESLRAITVNSDNLITIFLRTSMLSDFSSITEGLHAGPRQRGTQRLRFNLTDGTSGDVYRCVLLAICKDPPRLSFNYDDLMTRVRTTCIGEPPTGSSVTQALAQMDLLSNSLSPRARVLEWDEDVLDIIEPYFLFYLRNSTKLRDLGV